MSRTKTFDEKFLPVIQKMKKDLESKGLTMIEFIDEVPKNMVGKVQRRALQEADPLFKKN